MPENLPLFHHLTEYVKNLGMVEAGKGRPLPYQLFVGTELNLYIYDILISGCFLR